MIPYANFSFFGLMLYVVVPTVLLGIIGRAGRRWAFAITILYLIAQFSNRLHVTAYLSVPNLVIVGGYAVFEWLIATLFLAARLRSKSLLRFCIAFLLALSPLLAAKFLPQSCRRPIICNRWQETALQGTPSLSTHLSRALIGAEPKEFILTQGTT